MIELANIHELSIASQLAVLRFSQIGDHILSINGTSTSSLSVDDVLAKLQEAEGAVEIEIQREAENK